MARKSNPGSGIPERLLTIQEFAQARHCSTKTVRRLIAEGKLPVIRTGRLLRIHPRFLYEDL